MKTTSAAPQTVAAALDDGTSSAAPSSPGLEALPIRELICELAATEALLAERPVASVRRATLRQQTLIIGELRRRARGHQRDPNAHICFGADADDGALPGSEPPA